MNIRMRRILPKHINYNDDVWKCEVKEKNVAIVFSDVNDKVKNILKNYTLIKLKMDRDSLSWVNNRYLKDFLNYLSTKDRKETYRISFRDCKDYISSLINKGCSINEIKYSLFIIEELGKTFKLVDFEIFKTNKVYELSSFFEENLKKD